MSYKFNTVWSLVIVPQKKTLIGLTPRELQAIVAAYDHSKIDDLYVWTPFFDDWKQARHIDPLMSFKGLEVIDEPPVFNFHNNVNENVDESSFVNLVTRKLEDDLDTSEIQSGLVTDISDVVIESLDKQILPRKYSRLNRQYPIEIEVNGNVFKTISSDISVGGMQVKDELPEWVTGYFSVKIFQPLLEQSLVHTGWVIESEKNKRNRIAFLPFKKQETETQFEEWIKAAA
ncbi:MAG: PilZ domain-containing protein [Bdellovibrionales bacterium]|nr:PilZ domain-containing protein [Bdellovibrionales bacterium]